MSGKPDKTRGKRQGDPRADGADLESADRPRDAGYDVGYGKPPEHTRFAKGRSGNPRGRPRKPKPKPPRLSDAPSDSFLEEEAYRSIALRENGQAIELPATQAVMRSLIAEAIKGKRLAQKYFLEHVSRQEEQHFQHKMHHYRRLEALKRDGERALAEHRRRSLPPPDLLPHPDDIVLDPATAEARIDGPTTPEEAHFYEHSAQWRDLALLCSVYDSESRRKASAEPADEAVYSYLLLAQLLDQVLPRRYRWRDNAEVTLYMDYQGLPRRERERRIAAELAQLKATRPRLSRVTPEMAWEAERISRKFLELRERHAG